MDLEQDNESSLADQNTTLSKEKGANIVAIRSPAKIYTLLEDRLRRTKDPLTSVDLYGDPEIRRNVEDSDRLSDYLGHMWRRGLLQRWYAPKTADNRARYAYTWKEAAEDEATRPVEHTITALPAVKPNVKIVETEHGVVLEFDRFRIIVQSK